MFLLCGGECGADLVHDLGLSENGGVQAGGDGEEVLGDCGVVGDDEVWSEAVCWETGSFDEKSL